MATMTWETTLTSLECSQCGITFAAPEFWLTKRREDHATFYCPSGHSQYFPQKSDADRLRDQLATKIAVLDQRDARIKELSAEGDRITRSLRGTKAVVTRMRRRIVAGRCVCCSHTFEDLKRHMATQHPDFDPSRAAEALAGKAPR